MNQTFKTLLTFAEADTSVPVAALVALYERVGFEGRCFTTGKQMTDLERQDFDDRSFSVVVTEAVAGGAVGATVGRNNNQQATTRDIHLCETVPSQTQPALWDVSYNFRGQDHPVHLTNPPGATVTVNRSGEPRA